MSRFRIVKGIIAEEMAKPYAYGEADCFFFGIAMIDALRGSDLRSIYAGSYSTLRGAQMALRRRRFSSLADLFATHLPPIAPAQAAMGDIVVLDLGGAEHVGVCVGPRFVTKTDKGASFHGLATVKAAFRT